MIDQQIQQKKNISKAARNRINGVHQIEKQKQEILKAAEKLFLQNGIENTKMTDITREAGITKATIYRYFPNREEIAVQVQMKMLEKMSSILGVNMSELTIENTRRIVKNMIEKFDELQDALRFIEYFDRAYLNNSYESSISKEARERVCQFFWGDSEIENNLSKDQYYKKIVMLTNAVTFFCGGLALRRNLYWSIPGVEISETMNLFEDMLVTYLDSTISEK